MRKISFVVAAALVAASFSPSIAAGPSAAGKAKMKKGEANIGENVSDAKYDDLVAEMKKEKEEDKKDMEEEVIRARDKDDPRNIRRNLRR